jgi:hypothetical protein
MLKIDGNTYDVDVVSCKRKADFLDKYAERSEDGNLHRELIGVYFNYQLKLGPGINRAEYDRLWEKLSEPEAFHTVRVPYSSGEYTFIAYFSNLSDELLLCHEGVHYWNGLTVNFTAKSPART